MDEFVLDRDYSMEPFYVVGIKKNKNGGYDVSLASHDNPFGGHGMYAPEELGKELEVGTQYRLWIIADGKQTMGFRMVGWIYKNKVYVSNRQKDLGGL